MTEEWAKTIGGWGNRIHESNPSFLVTKYCIKSNHHKANEIPKNMWCDPVRESISLLINAAGGIQNVSDKEMERRKWEKSNKIRSLSFCADDKCVIASSREVFITSCRNSCCGSKWALESVSISHVTINFMLLTPGGKTKASVCAPRTETGVQTSLVIPLSSYFFPRCRWVKSETRGRWCGGLRRSR